MNGPIRLVLADDYRLVRATIRKVLDRDADFEIVGEASDNDQAIERCRALAPDVLLLDMRMRGTPTRDLIATLKRAVPKMQVLILSADEAPVQLSELLGAGISGYVVKDDATEELPAAIHAVAEGTKWYSRTIQRNYRALLNGKVARDA